MTHRTKKFILLGSMTASEKRKARAEVLAEYRKELTRKMIAARWGTKTAEERSEHARMMALARYKKVKKNGRGSKNPLAST